MITYWVDRAGVSGIQDYLAGIGEPLRDRFFVRRYEFVEETIEVPSGPQIFAALDQLTAPERSAIAIVQDRLARVQPEFPLLNDPRRSLLRPALLARMADEEINTFRAWSAQDSRRVSRFPVFIRGAYDHGGSLTGLLGSSRVLRQALLALRVRGYRLADLLIVEFCDTSDRHGVFRKYSAMRVGDAIVPIHLLAGHHWVVKGDSAERTVELGREALAYLERNPHESWVRQAFALAGIEFGRVDYGVREGRPQLWEINMNPTMGRRRPRPVGDPQAGEVWERARKLAHARLREAFAALDRGDGPERLAVGLDLVLRAQIARALRRKRRRRLALDLLTKTYDSPLGAPLRAVFHRIVPRR